MKNIDFKKIKNQFNLIIEKLDYSKVSNQKIFTVSFDIDKNSVYMKNELLTSHCPFIFSSNTFSVCGFIREKFFSFDTKNEYQDNKNKILKYISESFAIDNNSDTKTFIFGGLSFDLNQNYDDIWKDVPLINFTLPRYILHDSKLIINLYTDVKMSLEKIKLKISTYIDELEKMYSNNSINFQPELTEIKNLKEKNIYCKKINHLLNKLKNKDESITKVVVSRIKKATFKNKIPLFNIFNNLVRKNTDNMNFLYSINDDINIIGSSPELIISKNGIKIKSESIAGTNYQTTTDDFTTNKKEIIEQKIVTKYINVFFKNNTTNILFNDKPNIKKSSNIEHLWTSFSADQNNNKSILDLLYELHPTPAIAGEPKKEALNIINSYDENRGWYGGPIGWIDNKLNGSFFLNIRSGLGINKDLYLFSGSGITDQSNADNEWIETEYKFNLMEESLK